MPDRQSLPNLWLLSDARNDAALEDALATLPPRSGFVFRHYHLASGTRRARFDALRALAERVGHLAILSGEATLATEWGAAGVYGPADRLAGAAGLLRLATAHDAAEVAVANAAGVDGVFISPVFPTRSHPGAAVLGPEGFRRLAALARAPAIALGGMDRDRAAQLGWPRWGAIDGLTPPIPAGRAG